MRRLSRLRSTDRRSSISIRLVGTYALIVAGTLFMVAAITLHLTRNHLRAELDERLAAAIKSFQEGPARQAISQEELEPEARSWLSAQAFPRDQIAAVRYQSNTILSTTSDIHLERISGANRMLQSSSVRWWDLQTPQGESVRGVTAPIMSGTRQIGTVTAAASRSESEQMIGVLLNGVAWAGLVGIFFSSLLGLLAVRRHLRPLRKMSQEVEVIQSTGDLSRRVGHDGPVDEVGRLAAAFDEMLARLQISFENQKQFLSDASHELRTPLTVVRGQLDLLADGFSKNGDSETAQAAIHEIDRMGSIVEDLLLLARLDEGLTLSEEPVEVELIVQEALIRGLLENARESKVDCEEELFVKADPRRLLQVLTNLVRNAAIHAGEDAEILIKASRTNRDAVIEVTDNGRGILPEDVPRVFDRFFRSSTSRSQVGSGLGLAIAKSLVEAMGGRIEAESMPMGGSTFRIRVKAAEVPAGPRSMV